MTVEQKTCKARVGPKLKSHLADIRKLWSLYKENPEASDPDVGTWPEYGLSFDYVAPGTFSDQKRGFFCYQLSYGGPQEEFRFFTDENLNPIRIEFWFLDWFDGARIVLHGKDADLLTEIWQDWKETGTVKHVYEEATQG